MEKLSLQSFRPRTLFIAASALIIAIAIIVSAVAFLSTPAKDRVYSKVTLSYDGVSSGLDPFKNPLNLFSFVSDDLVGEALGNLGMRDKYDIANVMACLSVSGESSDSTINTILKGSLSDVSVSKADSRTGYYPSTYRITLQRDFDKRISASKMRALLDEITRLLCEKFKQTYSRLHKSEVLDSLVSETTHEYVHRLDVDCDRLRSIQAYADELAEKYPNFSNGNMNYLTVSRKCSDLLSDKAAQIRSFITTNGLTNNTAWLPDYYEYSILMLRYRLTALQSALTSIDGQISSFEVDSTVYLGSSDSVVKVESRSKETYQELVSRRIEIKNEISTSEARIESYTQLLDKIRKSAGSETLAASLRADFEIIENKTDEIAGEFAELLNAQNGILIEGMITAAAAKTEFRTLFSAEFVSYLAKRLLITVTAVAAAGFLVSAFGDKKKKKKKKAVSA